MAALSGLYGFAACRFCHVRVGLAEYPGGDILDTHQEGH
jgi:hypothetical protein